MAYQAFRDIYMNLLIGQKYLKKEDHNQDMAQMKNQINLFQRHNRIDTKKVNTIGYHGTAPSPNGNVSNSSIEAKY